MTNPKIVKMKKRIPPGTDIPVVTSSQVGNQVGIWAENVLEDLGYPINRGKGSDLPGIETKTRRVGTTSPMSIGSMTTKDIINTPWDQTILKEKFQQIEITNWNKDFGRTVGNDTVDLRDEDSQSRLRDAYERAREKIRKGEDKYTGLDNDVYFEKKSKNNWQMRISAEGLERIKSRVWSLSVLNNKELFPDD